MDHDDFRATFEGESELIEFKQGLPELKIREAVTAFSNTDGGIVLLGVRNDGTIQGLDTGGETEAKLHRAVLGVRDSGRYAVHRLDVDDRSLLVLSVQRRREGFAQLQDGRVLVRRGAMNTPLFGQELSTFIAARALSRFETTNTPVDFVSAEPVLIEQIRRAFGWTSLGISDLLEQAGLVSPSQNGLVLTVAGALCMTARPGDVLGKTFVEIFRHRDESSAYDKRIQIDGPVDRQVEDSVSELMAELGSDVVVLGLRRHELPRIPEAVLREVLANAVAHRSYEMSSQPVRIDMWPDRIVVRSPGGLPEPVTIDNLREQSAARNANVTKVLRRYRLAEDAGMGVDVIEDTMEAALLERPRFESDGTYVSVVLRLGSTVTPRERAWIAEVERRGEIRPSDRLVLLHAARGEVLTNTSVRDLLNIDSVHARGALVRLRDLGYLVQSGARGGATYSLAKELGPPAGLQLDPSQLSAVVLGLAAEQETITNETVRERTGLDRAQALQLLTSMTKAGQLVRHGERRGTYYTTPTFANKPQP